MSSGACTLTVPSALLATMLCSQRDGCPQVINIGQARTDWYYQKKRFGFQAR